MCQCHRPNEAGQWGCTSGTVAFQKGFSVFHTFRICKRTREVGKNGGVYYAVNHETLQYTITPSYPL